MSATMNPDQLPNQQDAPTRDAGRYPARYSVDGIFQGHQIDVQLRLSASFGGVDDGEVINTHVLNDTGAAIGSMYRSTWQRLNVFNVPIQHYAGVKVFDGSIEEREAVTFEMRLVTYSSDGHIEPISDWLVDQAILLDDPQPGQEPVCLSGDAMRRSLFFLTSPRQGRDFLYVASSKDAMMKVLNSL